MRFLLVVLLLLVALPAVARDLTQRETDVLAHVVCSPTTWWAHAQTVQNVNAENALAAKVARHGAAYDAAKAAEGANYKTRAQRDPAC